MNVYLLFGAIVLGGLFLGVIISCLYYQALRYTAILFTNIKKVNALATAWAKFALRAAKCEPPKRILHLTLYREWFDKIATGQKTKEFRLWTPYWNKRLINREYDEIHFRNGYGKNRPFMRVECTGITLAVDPNPVFVICLGEILEIKNYEFNKIGKASLEE